MMTWWTQFSDLLINSVHFRAGFLWGLGVALLLWAASVVFRWLYARWLRVRQFFEPIKKPGKMPVEAGSSPASILLGCVGSLLGIVLLVATVVMVLLWTATPGGS